MGESGEDKGIVMFIKKINIQKNGKLTEKLMFNQGLSIVKGSADLYDVITPITISLSVIVIFIVFLCVGCSNSRNDNIPESESELDKIYYIRGHKSKGERLFEYKVFYDDNVECTDEYLAMVQQNKELESSLFFHAFKKQNFPHRLMHYKDVLKYYPNGDFASLTNGYGTTRSFRGFMTEYIKYFKPIKLHKGKDLFLKLSNSGQFYVESVNCGEKVLLSDSENTLYHYLSFISIADFWDRAEKIRNMNGVRKPLIVSSFLERIDESIDITNLLEKTNSLDRQIIMLVPNTVRVLNYNVCTR